MLPSLKTLYRQVTKSPKKLLTWHLEDILDNLSYETVLDVGGVLALAGDIIIHEGVKKIYVIDPTANPGKHLSALRNDSRFSTVYGPLENINWETLDFGLVFLDVDLPWLNQAPWLIKKIAERKPDYLVITGRKAIAKTIASSIEKAFNEPSDQKGYFPLIVRRHKEYSAVLYTRDLPDRSVYDQAKYIIQVNSSCNCDCPWCYVDKLGITMEEKTFQKILAAVHDNDIISLRGGEPTLSKNLLSSFVQPALQRGAYVILESNGLFIGKSQYQDYLNTFSQSRSEIRLSLDKPHLLILSTEESRQQHLNKIARFVEDAQKHQIKFGLYSLGMDMKQVGTLLAEYSLSSLLQHVKPLTKYLTIEDLAIRGKYIDVFGEKHNHITGIKHSQYDKGQSA